MKITFQTKEESNLNQQEEFLKLSGGERVLLFFELSKKINVFPLKNEKQKSNNFVIDFTKKNDSKLG